MDVKHRATGPKTNRIELQGEYDLSRKEEVNALFATLSTDSPATIDLSRVTYADSTILHELAMLNNRLKGQLITLTGAIPSVRRLLEVVKFDQLFRIVDA